MRNFVIACLVAGCIALASAQKCTNEIENCNSCENKAAQCDMCPNGWTANKDYTKCTQCDSNCLNCTMNAADTATECTMCASEFYVKSGQCEGCSSNCMTCNSTGCSTCKSGYALSATTKECISCGSNCKSCSLSADDTPTCSSCNDYYYKKSTDGSCASCPSKSATCSSKSDGKAQVDSCMDGYVVLLDSEDATKDKSKCLTCPSACAACSGEVNTGSTAKCTSCNDAYYFDSDACPTCVSAYTGCAKCDADGCLECLEKYALNGDDATCSACPANCDVCEYDTDLGATKCTVCKETYGLKPKADETCVSCPSNCATCTVADDVTGDGGITCTACVSNYGLHPTTKACSICPGSGAGVCSACTYDSTDADYDCDAGSCPDGYWLNTGNTPQSCDACSANCKTCTSASICDVCTDTTTHATQTKADTSTVECFALPANTLTLTGDSDTAKAASCVDGYFLDATPACAACAADCKTCTDATAATCTVCNDGFSDKDTDVAGEDCYTCSGASTNCKTCTFTLSGTDVTATACTACNTGYVEDGGNCYACPGNCDTCTYSGGDTTCTACKTKYAVKSDGSGNCGKCADNCDSCTVEGECTSGSCKTGYALNSGNTCDQCPENCDACAYNSDVLECTTCNTGYGKSEDKTECQICPNKCDACAYSTDNSRQECTTCTTKYGLNPNYCSSCVSNAESCAFTDMVINSIVCKDTYALVGEVCSACTANCDECGSSLKCNSGKCQSGRGRDTNGACSVCSDIAFANCASCGDKPDVNTTAECFSCASGYYLKDGLTSGANAACLADPAGLDCGSTVGILDTPDRCSECASGFNMTSDYMCARKCLTCGSFPDNYMDAEACRTAVQGATPPTEDCLSGICYGTQRTVNGVLQVIGGCMPTTGFTCTTGKQFPAFECSQASGMTSCDTCCSDRENCLSDLATDFQQNGVAPVAVGISAMLMALLAAFVF